MIKNKKYKNKFLRGIKVERKLYTALKQQKYAIFCNTNFIIINKTELTNLYIYEIGSSSVLTR